MNRWQWIAMGVAGWLVASAAAVEEQLFRWVNATAEPLAMAAAGRQVHPPLGPWQAGPPARQPAGSRQIVVSRAGQPVEQFQWEVVARPRRPDLLVSMPAAGGQVQTRVLGYLERAGEKPAVRVLNASGGWTLDVAGAGVPVRVRAGREIVLTGRTEVSGSILAGDQVLAVFVLTLPEGNWNAMLVAGPQGAPAWLWVRGRDGALAYSWDAAQAGWPVARVSRPAPARALAAARREPAAPLPAAALTERRPPAVVPAARSDAADLLPVRAIDPAGVDWSQVSSRICWFNACRTSEALSLECRGTVLFQRVRGGAVTGFLKWPAGEWPLVVSGRASGVVGRMDARVGEGGKLLLVTTGGAGHALQSLVMNGPAELPAAPRLRVVNALPCGTMRRPVDDTLEAIEPARAGAAVVADDGVFAALDFSHPGIGHGVFKVVVPRIKLARGDWLAIVHLDEADAPQVTWLDMYSGRIVEADELAPPAAD